MTCFSTIEEKFCVFFYLFIYLIVIANILFFKSIAWNLLSQILYSVSVSGFRIPCFSAAGRKATTIRPFSIF